MFADYAPLSDIFTEIQMTHTCTGRLCNLSSKSCICTAVCLHFTFSLALVVCVRNRFFVESLMPSRQANNSIDTAFLAVVVALATDVALPFFWKTALSTENFKIQSHSVSRLFAC